MEIKNLKNQLLYNIKYDDIKPGEKLIVINITSKDKKINFPITCKTSTLFAEIKRTFYEKYPAYCKNDKKILFKQNGLKVKGFQTMLENGFPGYELKIEKKSLDK